MEKGAASKSLILLSEGLNDKIVVMRTTSAKKPFTKKYKH
jgi:hypothetical protein